MDRFLPSTTAAEREQQRNVSAAQIAAAHTATAEQLEGVARHKAEKKQRSKKPGPKPKRQPAQLSAPGSKKQKKSALGSKRDRYTNWWHPLLIALILEAVEQTQSFKLAVQGLQAKYPKIYKRLDPKTVRGWFHKRANKFSPFVLTDKSRKRLAAARPVRQRGKTPSFLTKVSLSNNRASALCSLHDLL